MTMRAGRTLRLIVATLTGLALATALSVAPVLLTGGAPLLPRRLEGRLRLTDASVAGAFAELRYAVDPPR